PPSSTLFPYTTLFRSAFMRHAADVGDYIAFAADRIPDHPNEREGRHLGCERDQYFAERTQRLGRLPGRAAIGIKALHIHVKDDVDRKSTRLNSSHDQI